MLIRGIVECVKALPAGQEYTAQCGTLAAGGGVGNEDSVGESADKAIALFCECCRNSVLRGWKGREDEQAAILEGWLEFGLETHSDDASRWNPDDGLAATEKDSKALPFHDGVEAANEYLTFIAHPRDGIEGLQDDGAGTLGGTEEADLGAR